MEDNDEDQTPTNQGNFPSNQEQDNDERRPLNREISSSIQRLRSGQQLSSPSRHQLHPSHIHTSPVQSSHSLSSQSLDLSPQPGPSGLHFITNVSHDQSHDPNQRSHDQSSRVTHSAFHVPPSQDVFAGGGDITFDLEASQSEESQSIPPGPPSIAHTTSEPRPPEQSQPRLPGPPSPPVLIPGPDLASHLEQHSQYEQQYKSWYDKDKQDRQNAELMNYFRQSEQARWEQSQPLQGDAAVSPQEREGARHPKFQVPLLQNLSDELASRATRSILRHRHAPVRVPGTESSQSSDDSYNFGAQSREAAIDRAIAKTYVGGPESKLATTQYTYKDGDQAIASTTASSESDQGQLQALSEDENLRVQEEKVTAKRVHVQKVPRLKKSNLKKRQDYIDETRAPPPIIAEPFICTTSSMLASEGAATTSMSCTGSLNEGDDEMTRTEPDDEHVTGGNANSEPGDGVTSNPGDGIPSEDGDGVPSELEGGDGVTSGTNKAPSTSGSRQRVSKSSSSSSDRRRRREGESRTPLIRAAPPSWGAGDTDGSTDYPATQTSSSSGTTSSSSGGASNISGLSVGQSLDHTSSQIEGNSQPMSQTIPVSSTPQDDEGTSRIVMPPPSSLLTPNKKKSSSDTTTTSTSSSSGSGGHLTKTRSNITWPSVESIPESDQRSVDNEQETTSSPLARQTPTPPQSLHHNVQTGSTTEAIPSTGDEQVDLDDLSQIIEESSHSVREIGCFQHRVNTRGHGRRTKEHAVSPDDLGNQMPKWCSSEVDSQFRGDSEEFVSPTKRPTPPSSGSSNDHASLSPRPPPAKKRREESQTSSTVNTTETSHWQRDSSSNTATNIGPSMQAQPTSIPSISSKKSTNSASQDVNRDVSSSPSVPNRSITSSSGSSIISSTYPASSSCDPMSQSHSTEVMSGQSSTPSGSYGNSSGEMSSSSSSQRIDGNTNFNGVNESQETHEESMVQPTRSIKPQVMLLPDSVDVSSIGQPVSQSTQDSFLNARKVGGVLGVANSGSSSVASAQSVPAEVTPAPSLFSESVDMFEESVTQEPENNDQSYSHVDTIVATSTSEATVVPPDAVQIERETVVKDNVSSGQTSSHQVEGGYRSTTEICHSPMVIESPTTHHENIDHHTSSELLPEPPGSPEILQTKEELDCSEEIAVQAPKSDSCVIVEQPASMPTSCSTHDDERGAEDESMEVEMFSQNLNLHLSQSQSATPISQSSHAQNNSNSNSNAIVPLVPYSGSTSVNEIEQHEKECPNLFAAREGDTSVISEADKSVGEDKGNVSSSSQRSKSDTSMSSSSGSSQGHKTGSGSGSDPSPPNSGGNSGSHDDSNGAAGASGDAGKTGEDQDKGGDGDKEKADEQNTSQTSSNNNSADTNRGPQVNQQVQLNEQPPTVSNVQRSKPVPLYESVTYDSEVIETRNDSTNCDLPTGTLASVAQLPVLASDRVRQIIAIAGGGGDGGRESQHSVDLLSQATSSGTPFQFRLPQDGFLHPTSSMTPPSQHTMPFTPPLTTLPHSTHHPPPVTQSTITTTMLSPTEISTNIFRSVTPSPQISQTTQLPQGTTPVNSHLTNDKISTSASVHVSAASSSERGSFDKEVDLAAATLSSDPANLRCTDKDTQPSENNQAEELPDVICIGSSSPTKQSNAEQTKVVAVTPKRVADMKLSVSPSPRRSLSLKKSKTNAISTSSSIRKQLITESRQSTDRTKETGFVMGMDSQQGDSQLTDPCTLNSDLPAIDVRESQFEFSEESNALFQIENPLAQVPPTRAQVDSNCSTNQVPVSVSDTSRNTNLFSNFKASETSRKASKQAKGSSSTSNTLYTTRVHRSDPYEYSSQNEQSAEMEFDVMKRKSKLSALSKSKTNDGEVDSNAQDRTNRFNKVSGMRNESLRDGSRGDGFDSAGDELTSEGVNDSESQQSDASSCPAAESVVRHGTVESGAQLDKDDVAGTSHDGGQSVLAQAEKTSTVEESQYSVSGSTDAQVSPAALSTVSIGPSKSNQPELSTSSSSSQHRPVSDGVTCTSASVSNTGTALQSQGHTSTSTLLRVELSSSQTQTTTSLLTSTPPTAHNQVSFISQSNANAIAGTSQHGPFSSSSPSSLMEFSSPKAMISQADLQKLKRPFSENELKSYKLHYVRVTRTVVEEKVICSEVIHDGKVVPGSCKVCHVHERTEPQTSHESFELTPLPLATTQTSAPPTPSRTASISTKSMTTSTSHNLNSPTIISPLPYHQHNASVASGHAPLSSGIGATLSHVPSGCNAGSSCNIKSPMSLGIGSVYAATPTHQAPGVMSPVTLVRPVSNTSATIITSPYQQHTHPLPVQHIMGTTNHQIPIERQIHNNERLKNNHSVDVNCQEDPLPCIGKSGMLEQQSTSTVVRPGTASSSQTAFVSANNEVQSNVRRSPRKGKESLSSTLKRKAGNKGRSGKARESANSSTGSGRNVSQNLKRARDNVDDEDSEEDNVVVSHVKKKQRPSGTVKLTKGPTAKESKVTPRTKHPDIFYTTSEAQKSSTTSNTSNTLSSNTDTTNKPSNTTPSLPNGEKNVATSSDGANTVTRPRTPEIGSSVMARWTDKHWYPGTVVGENKSGKLNIDFADGNKGQVLPRYTFPLESLKDGVAVTAVCVQDRELKETRGVFAGLDKGSPQEFFLRVGNEISRFDLDVLCLPPESAASCMSKGDHTGEIDSRRRKRPVKSSPTWEEPASKRKKLNGPKLTLPRPQNVSISKLSTQQHRIFAGHYFILTHKPVDDKIADSPSPGPVNKELISSQIKTRGGFIVESFVDKKIVNGRYLVLSDCHCRTQKYLLALALGVPIISYSWVKDCVAENKLISYDEYRLYAGDPLDGGPPVEWTPRERGSILDGVNVYIHSSSDVFKNRWNVIVKEAGAHLLSKLPSVNQMVRSSNFAANLCNTVVICESTHQVPTSMTHRATNSGLKLVTSEWVVQSLIHGKKLENYKNFW